MNKAKLEVFNVSAKYVLPLADNEFLDLRKAFEELHVLFPDCVSYDPEFGFRALLVELGDLKFRIHSSGKIILLRLKFDCVESAPHVLNGFWKNYLKQFVKVQEDSNAL